MNIFFLINGNIYNYSLALEQYIWDSNCWLFGCSPFSAYAIPPNPPASTNTGEPTFAQSYINAYNTAFNQETSGYNLNYQKALNNYNKFTYSDVNSNFVPGTFGYKEEYNTPSQRFYINYFKMMQVYMWEHLICFSRFRRRVRIYVLNLDYCNIWRALCCECILKNIAKKLAGKVI
jgi:hypothetical protein